MRRDLFQYIKMIPPAISSLLGRTRRIDILAKKSRWVFSVGSVVSVFGSVGSAVKT